MKKTTLILMIFILLCSGYSLSAQTKSVKNKLQRKKTPAVCKSGEFTFPCPGEYKIFLNNQNNDGLFLAKNPEFGYSTFAIYSGSKTENTDAVKEKIDSFLKILYPKEAPKYSWKELDHFSKNNSSEFEVDKKLLIGFNGNQIVTIDYRTISFKDKNFIIGTLVNGWRAGLQAKNDFNDNLYTTNGGCSDADEIIRSITGEQEKEEYTSCSRTVIYGTGDVEAKDNK